MKLDEECGYTTNKESAMSEHEAIDPVHAVNTQSFEEELSSEEDLDEWLNAELEKYMSKQEGKNEEDAIIAIIKSIREEYRDVYKNKQIRVAKADLKKSSQVVEDTVNLGLKMCASLLKLQASLHCIAFKISHHANIDASNNVMPMSIYEYLKLANLKGAAMSFQMDDMTQQETLGTVKNVLVKINKFEFPLKGSWMGFADFLQVRYRNQIIDDTTREWRYYEWVAQNYEIDNNMTTSATTSFNVEYEYPKEIKNPYSQRFNEYKRVFDNKVENLSNEYTLRIGKKVPAARRQLSRPTRPVIAW
uniref:Uncharacterized protein n=1 Tax=Tanacetum cinerariifolium TaxID=118510 RepID=A0A6L2JJ68_TANCI|nr:hypothetical protein [Tanacetum cinerariifolium]